MNHSAKQHYLDPCEQIRGYQKTNKQPIQIYAKDTSDPEGSPPFELIDGDADKYRADCHSGRFICPVPGCKSPSLTTSGGSKRHHFRHLKKPQDWNHKPEGISHYNAKQLIGKWARNLNIGKVYVDSMHIETGQLPDVLIEMNNGHRIAFEIQYSPITIEEWNKREDGYRSSGIESVWIWGDRPPHLKFDRHENIRLSQFLCHVSQYKSPLLLWILPEQEQIAIRTWDTSCEGRDLGKDLSTFSRVKKFDVVFEEEVGGCPKLRVHAMTDCKIDERGFCTPTHIEEDAARETRLAIRSKIRKKQEAREAAWLPLKNKLLRKMSSIPPIIEKDSREDWTFLTHEPAHWHTLFFINAIQQKIGQLISPWDALREFRPQYSWKQIYRAGYSYLEKLKSHGYIYYLAKRRSFPTHFLVLSDTFTPPSHRLSRILERKEQLRFGVSKDGLEVISQHVFEILTTIPTESREASRKIIEKLAGPNIMYVRQTDDEDITEIWY